MSAPTTTSMSEAVIFVNDEPRPLGAETTVLALLHTLGLAERPGVAVALNGTVAPRATWPAHALATGDRVLVIRATQGG